MSGHIHISCIYQFCAFTYNTHDADIHKTYKICEENYTWIFATGI